MAAAPEVAIYLSFLLAIIIIIVFQCRNFKRRNLAPGPPSLPLVGHLHLLAKGPDAPHVFFMKLARRYGPVMSLHFGSVPVLVASTNHAAKEVLKRHDLVFVSRPPTAFGRLLFYGYQDFAFAPYNEKWRQLRKLCTLELFTSRRVESYKNLRCQELGSLLRSLFACRGEVVDMRKLLKSTTFNFICRILIGKQYYDPTVSKDHPEAIKFMHLLDEIARLAGAFPIGDFLPYFRWLNLDNVEKDLKTLSKDMDFIMEKILVEHEEKKDPSSDGATTQDFVDLILKLRDQGEECLQKREVIKSLLMNLFAGGSDTSNVTMEWILAELIKHPECMAKLQAEMAELVGLDRLVEESDIPKLGYLDAVVKETLRLHPPAPLLLPHYSTQDCNVMGYDISKGTTLFVNAYAIGRDPDAWEEPLEFRPDRFMVSKIDYKGQNYEFIPFGSGRRICPGISMGLSVVYISLANLVHAFNWEMPPGHTVDTVTEDYGVIVAMTNKLQAIPRARLLNRELYNY